MTTQDAETGDDEASPLRRSTLITSLNNPAVKRIRRLRLRHERESTGLFFVEGVRFVLAALEQGAEIETLSWCRSSGTLS